jgi:hypothetical protein
MLEANAILAIDSLDRFVTKNLLQITTSTPNLKRNNEKFERYDYLISIV